MAWLSSHVGIVLIAALGLACLVVIAVSLANAPASSPQEGIAQPYLAGGKVPDVPMETNTYPAVDALVRSYFEATARGDSETVRTLVRTLDETEALSIEVRGEYIEDIPELEIYTKKGLLPDTYIAYVLNYVHFKGYGELVPGMKSFYIRKGEDGEYYIQMGNVAADEEAYITGITLQQDVKDLNNRVAVEYNELIANNPELNDFLEDVKVMTKERVGEMMVQEEQAEENGETAENPASGEAPSEFPVRAKVSTKINVRSSDSIEADKKGQLAGGEEVLVLENRANGWSKISFQDGEAFVKTEYLTFVKTEAASERDVTGSVKAKENVNIRAEADQDSAKLGVAQGGETLQLIERLPNGWCKILYNNAVAYVKSEYVE